MESTLQVHLLVEQIRKRNMKEKNFRDIKEDRWKKLDVSSFGYSESRLGFSYFVVATPDVEKHIFPKVI